MRYFILFLIFASSTWGLEIPETIILKSRAGHEVEIVAVYQVSPEGLIFAPKPDAPLIGSRTLKKITTSWENIDLMSLPDELKNPVKAALEGKKVALKLGPEFFDLEDAVDLASEIPNITVSYNYTISSREFMTNSEVYRSSSHYMQKGQALKVMRQIAQHWRKISRELEKINYRPDVIRYRDTLERAAKAVEGIKRWGPTFNQPAANSAKPSEKGFRNSLNGRFSHDFRPAKNPVNSH